MRGRIVRHRVVGVLQQFVDETPAVVMGYLGFLTDVLAQTDRAYAVDGEVLVDRSIPKGRGRAHSHRRTGAPTGATSRVALVVSKPAKRRQEQCRGALRTRSRSHGCNDWLDRPASGRRSLAYAGQMTTHSMAMARGGRDMGTISATGSAWRRERPPDRPAWACGCRRPARSTRWSVAARWLRFRCCSRLGIRRSPPMSPTRLGWCTAQTLCPKRPASAPTGHRDVAEVALPGPVPFLTQSQISPIIRRVSRVASTALVATDARQPGFTDQGA